MFNEKCIKKLDLNSIAKKDDSEGFMKSKSLADKNISNIMEMNEKEVFNSLF